MTVTPPAGKIYKVVMTATVRTVQVPFTASIIVSGKSETWFKDRVNGHFNWSASAGDIFGWINQYGLDAGDSASYGSLGDGRGMVSVSGMLTNQTTADFEVQTFDITDGTSGTSVTPAQSVEPLVRSGQLADTLTR